MTRETENQQNQEHIDSQISKLFFDTCRLWRAQINFVLAEYDMTASAWSVIRLLQVRGEGKTQKELASELAIEGPTLVKLLDGLERRGWIERRVSPLDRRAKTIWLIPDALPQIQQADAKLNEMRHEIISVCPDEDHELLLRSIGAILEKLEQMNHEQRTQPAGGHLSR